MYEPEVEVKKIKKELEKIQKECDDFKNEIAVSSLMKTGEKLDYPHRIAVLLVNDFQATFSKSLDEIQKNLNVLPARGSAFHYYMQLSNFSQLRSVKN